MAHVAQRTGRNEWYTPQEVVDAARAAMGGIDLDPASTIEANETVRARRIYTVDDDGLAHLWWGRVFLNPPYARGTVDLFVRKLLDEMRSGRVFQAIVLVNNATETGWGQSLLSYADALCWR